MKKILLLATTLLTLIFFTLSFTNCKKQNTDPSISGTTWNGTDIFAGLTATFSGNNFTVTGDILGTVSDTKSITGTYTYIENLKTGIANYTIGKVPIPLPFTISSDGNTLTLDAAGLELTKITFTKQQ